MRINVTIKPNSTKGPLITPQEDGSLTIYIREIAADGQANNALIKILSKHYNIAKSNITIISGHTSKRKIIELKNAQ
jgi:hypothetical protein